MKKWIKGIVIAIFVLLITLITAPFLWKGKVIKLLKTEVNNQLLAKVDFDENISLSLFKNFPKLTIGIEKTAVVGINEFEGDTLVYLPELSISMDAMAIWRGERANIKTIYLNEPYINLKVLADGTANWDIIKPDSVISADSSTPISLGLEKITIKNARFAYDDLSIPYSTFAKQLNLEATGDLEADNFTLNGAIDAESLDMTYAGLAFLNKIKAKVDVVLEMDMKNMRFTFKEGKAKLNNLDLESAGFLQLNENDIDMDLKFSSANTDFKNVLSLVPAVFAKDFKTIETNGKMAFDGFMKGKMTDIGYPAFGFSLAVENGYFKYPNLPEAVKNINLLLNITNKDGVMDHTVIDMPRFGLNVLNENITGRLNIKTPISDPLIDSEIKGKIDLAQVKKYFPLNEKESYQGQIDADIAINTYISYIETSQYDKVKTSGYFLGKDLTISSSALQDKLNINNLNLSFNPKTVDVKAFDGNFGKSDFNLIGKVENLIPYMFKNQTLVGYLSFSSNYFNTNPFMSETDAPQIQNPKPTDTAVLSYIDIPANLDIKFKADVKSLIYDNLNIKELKGEMAMANKVIAMSNIKGQLLGGDFNLLTGKYDATKPMSPFSDLDFKLNNVDIIQTAAYFDFINTLGPIAKYANGLFSIDFKMGTELLKDLSPKYQTFNGEGVIKLTNASIKGLKSLNQIGDMLKIERLKSFEVKDLLIKFKVINGAFALADSLSFPVYKGIKMKLIGSSTLAGDLTYFARFDIPRSFFGNANDQLNSLLSKTKAKGINIDISEIVPVDAYILGTFLNPKVELNLREAKKSLVDNVKNQIKDEANKKLDEGKDIAKAKLDAEKERAKQRALDSINDLKNKGKEKAASIMSEAEARAAAIKAEARRAAASQKTQIYAQADSIQRQGADPLQKLAARKTAEKIKLEADKAEQKAVAEADRRADAIMDKAREQADKVNRF